MQPQLFVHEESPRWWIRLVIGAVILVILWFLGVRVLSFFDFSSTQKAGAVLLLDDNPDGVQVSLQGGDVQRGEDQLKVYEGDTIYTSNNATALLTFFDGTHIRLDQQSQLTIDDSSRMSEKPSVLTVSLPKGRLFIATPNKSVFTGSIVRTIKTETQSVDVPASAHALIGDDLLAVSESSGLGLVSTIELSNGSSQEVTIGEGQVFALSPAERSQIESGEDPYAFRRTFNEKEQANTFLRESIAKLSSSAPLPSFITGSGAENSGTSSIILSVTSPLQNAIVTENTVTVSGRVGQHVASVQINSYTTSVGADKTFRQDLAIDSDTMTITITAEDSAGIALEKTTRTITRKRVTPSSPTVTAPVGSGGTFTTDAVELSIDGTAPANTNGIMVNDYVLQLFKPGARKWTYLASSTLGNMKPGENRYEIRAIDASGNKSDAAVITIVYTPKAGTGSDSVSSSSVTLPNNEALLPGSLIVSAPGTSPYETPHDEVLLEGKTPTVTDSVSVNGYKLSLYTPGKDFWNYYASTKYGTLRPGRNTYTIVTRNKEGKILDSLQYVIIYTPKAGQ